MCGYEDISIRGSKFDVRDWGVYYGAGFRGPKTLKRLRVRGVSQSAAEEKGRKRKEMSTIRDS